MGEYDSKGDTYEHIAMVTTIVGRCVQALIERCASHDRSKVGGAEKATFDEMTPKLKGSTYGSDEYKQFLVDMKPALDNHYAHNRHHPEHFTDGIRGMNCIDLLEMMCDWYAATKRHGDGDLMRSIEINQKRFGYSDELKAVMVNTARWLIDNEARSPFPTTQRDELDPRTKPTGAAK